MNARVQDMSGKRFAQLVAIKVSGKAASGDLKWEFSCDCGNRFEANGYYARIGKIISCPTCAKERSRLASVTHGLSNTPEFSTWMEIQGRCYNKKTKAYASYGARGIVVCDQWRQSFEVFLADMGKRPTDEHSIERLNNDGNYEPSNCKWATRLEQANNKRNNIIIRIGDVTKTLTQWCREFDCPYDAAWFRQKAGVTGMALFQKSKRS